MTGTPPVPARLAVALKRSGSAGHGPDRGGSRRVHPCCRRAPTQPPPRGRPTAASVGRRSRTWWSTSACRHRASATCAPTSSTRWSRSTRCACTSANAACWSSSRSTSARRRSSPSTPTSRPTRPPGSTTPAATASRCSSASASGRRADLLVANNVLAQVPDLNDFVAGMRLLLAPCGVATVEFPHLARLFEGNQFDTIYHEHFSYFSLLVAERVFAAHGLVVFDVEELPTHGGSLRLYLRHQGDASKPVRPPVAAVAAREAEEGFDRLEHHLSFGPRVEATKRKLLSFLIQARDRGRRTAGYGAPGKGNTLLNYCGIRSDLLDYTVDRNPYKQGRYLPGTHVPIRDPSLIARTRPDYVLILPWNLKDEVVAQLAEVRSWGGRFVVTIPEVTVL